MRLNSLARRYAQAIFNSAKDHNLTDVIMTDLSLVERVSKENNDFLKILSSPVVLKEKKKAIIKDLFEGKINDLTLDFIMLVIDKDREYVLLIIKDEFEKLHNEANSLSTLIVESVLELNEAQVSEIKSIMERKLSKKFTVETRINPELIGGVRLLFDDNVIDGSVKEKLSQIEEALIK
ncbi:MAG: ATP synthase F1 subunit delta [Abditibacteriota bacterium]|nr:ATP synthase F1 subunit delta [Abditibacteriota bacterium]